VELVAPKEHLRAGIYARVSTIEQAESGTSLATQLERCRAYAAANGWTVVGEYVDEGVSGTASQRPSLDALFSRVHLGELDTIVVLRLDRFARSMRHLCAMIEDLDGVGVQFVTVDGHFDTATPQGRLMRNILGSFAEFERDMIVERTSAGLHRVAADGYWPGGKVPYGWRLERSDGRNRPAVDDVAANRLRLMVTLLVDHCRTTGEVATHLNALAVPPPQAAQWNHNMVRDLLARAPLSGTWIWGKPRPSSPQPMNPPLDVSVPPIIDEQRHHQLLATLARVGTGRGPDSTRKFYAVGNGRLYGPCGGTFHGVYRRDRDYRQYRCGQSLHFIVNRCTCSRIFADDLEDRIWHVIDAVFGSPSRLVELIDSSWSRRRGRRPTSAESLTSFDTQIAELDRAILRLAVEYATAGLPAASLTAASKELLSRRDALSDRRQLLVQWEATLRRERHRARQLRHLAHLLRAERQMTDRHKQQRIYSWLDVTITITNWTHCPTCRQRGRLPGRRGQTCRSCRGAGRIPSLRIEGALSEDRLEALIRYFEVPAANDRPNSKPTRRGCDRQPNDGALPWTIFDPAWSYLARLRAQRAPVPPR
jgi:site-specific DNA recombinase